MKAFLGKHLDSVIKKNEVETNGRTILVTGPLSNAFTEALEIELGKKEGEVTPVVESFTDPKVLAKLIVDEATNRGRSTQNPMTIYAFDRSNITEDTVLEALIGASQTEDTGDYYVISDYTKQPLADMTSGISRTEAVFLEKALEACVVKMGGNYITNSSQLKATFESRDQNG